MSFRAKLEACPMCGALSCPPGRCLDTQPAPSRFDPAVSIPLGEAPPGHYHPDPDIDAEARADACEKACVEGAAGIREGWHRGPAEEPRPWTDAHTEAAATRLLEIDVAGVYSEGLTSHGRFLDRLNRLPGWTMFIERGLKVAMNGPMVVDPGENAFREILDGAYFCLEPARIDREVAIVRERSERPAPTLSRASADAELRREIAVEAGSGLSESHREIAVGTAVIALNKYRLALAEGHSEIGLSIDDQGRLVQDLDGVAFPCSREMSVALATEVLKRAAPEPDPCPCPGVRADVLHGSLDGPLLVAFVTIDPGAEVPRETHRRHIETILVTSGRLEIDDGVAWQTDEDHGAIVIDATRPHVVRNASDAEPAEYLSILRRVGTEDR